METLTAYVCKPAPWPPLQAVANPFVELQGGSAVHETAGAKNLKQPQVSAANGDERTQLPEGLTRPKHWRTVEAEKPSSAEKMTAVYIASQS